MNLQELSDANTDWPVLLDQHENVLEINDPWAGRSWREAAQQYHRDRAGRVLLVETAPERLVRLRGLMADNVSLDRAWNELRNWPAPEATVEAQMFSLRRGVNELLQPDTQHRMPALAEDQLEEVCHRVQNFKLEIAPPWSADDVDLLIAAWRKCREYC